MVKPRFCRLTILAVVLVVVQVTLASSYTPWPYIQIYPPVNETDVRTPLYFALVLSFGGAFTTIAALPGVQIALDYVNSNPSFLPGYSLHYTLLDSQCNHSTAVSTFFQEINNPPIKVGWVGSGCSLATEPTAELTQFYNITQLSCISSSPELKDRRRFRYYFQLVATEVLIAQGFYGIIKKFGWRRVGIIAQDENLFTASLDALKQELTGDGVNCTEKRFRTDEGISGLGAEIFEPGIRVYVLMMFSPHARDILCEAYKSGLRYPKHMIITYGWYANNWWMEPATSDQYNCTADERASVLLYTLAPVIREYPVDFSAQAEPDNINATEFGTRYFNVVDSDVNRRINLTNFIDDNEDFSDDNEDPYVYSYHCHEATIAFAYALNKTIEDLIKNDTVNSKAAKESGLPEGANFTMADFTYANSAVVSRMFTHLQNTSFPGISGNEVRFNKEGTRDVNAVAILQYQPLNGELVREQVALVTYSDGNNTLSQNNTLMLPDGVPNDGIPIEDVVTVSLSLTVVYVILAIAGMVFAVACLAFTLIFRERRLIRLSSRNLNYIIALGAIVLYLNVITFVIPTTNKTFAAVLCNINPWLTSLGYSLCYGTILIKMIRVWIIFNRPRGLKSSRLQDHFMVLGVLCLVLIDLAILGTYTLVEGVRGNLGVERITNREFAEETIGPTAIIHRYFLYVCESNGRVALYAVLYGYKGLLQVFALLLAFSTRKVKVKGLNDSKYIAAAIYVTSIVLAVTIVSTYTLIDYINVYPAVVGIGFLLGTTMILVLVFVPRMVGLYKDPHGDKITFLSTPLPRSIGDNEMRELRRRVVELENSLKRRRSSVPFSPNLDKLPPEVVNDRDVGESKVGFELDLAKAPNSQQTGDQLANSTDNKTI